MQLTRPRHNRHVQLEPDGGGGGDHQCDHGVPGARHVQHRGHHRQHREHTRHLCGQLKLGQQIIVYFRRRIARDDY